MERFAEDATLLQALREYLTEHGIVESKVVEGKQDAGEKFADYFDYSETLRYHSLASRGVVPRAPREMLTVVLRLDTEEKPKWDAPHNPCEGRIAIRFGIALKGRPTDKWLSDTVRWTWRVKVFMHLETELMTGLREKAEIEAINVFARNLKDLLLAAPAGPRATMGLDPGLRTGVKVAIVDATGKVVDTTAIYPHQPRNDWHGSLHTLSLLAEKHQVSLISIGNGTANFPRNRQAGAGFDQAAARSSSQIVVSETSVGVGIRFARIAGHGHISARCGVDRTPSARSVGRARRIDRNRSASDNTSTMSAKRNWHARLMPSLKTASTRSALMFDMKGMFTSRAALRGVPRLGDKTFEQAAGFLRIMNSDNPLDGSAVHPESYPLVEKILADLKKEVKSVIGDDKLLKSLNPSKYADEKFGVPTITDILKELEKPGRDPRPEFTTATFKEGVEEIRDLRPDMILEGVVTNVAAFGAFVDIGVHQDGLVHISALSNTYVKDPHTVVKAGQVVKVKVLEVDEKRKRIALTMRLADSAPTPGTKPEQRGDRNDAKRLSQHQQQPKQAVANSAMAAAFCG